MVRSTVRFTTSACAPLLVGSILALAVVTPVQAQGFFPSLPPVFVVTPAPVVAAVAGTTPAPVGDSVVVDPVAGTVTPAPVDGSAAVGGSVVVDSAGTVPPNGTQTSSSSSDWSGCVRTPADAVQLQQPTRVCLHVANGMNWAAGVNYVRAAFEPAADTYARLHIPNSYSNLVGASAAGNATQAPNTPVSPFVGRNVTINAASQFKNSLVRVYYDAETERVYPYFTMVIDVQQGIVHRITWDDACVFCGGFECVETTYDFNGRIQTASAAHQPTKSCSWTVAQCNALLAATGNSTACDLTLYVVWTGTDVKGQALQSHAYRFSEFPPQDLADRVTQLVDFGSERRLESMRSSPSPSRSWNEWWNSWRQS